MKKNDKKCICFARVSTKGQDYTDQMKEVKRAAISAGYKESEIVEVCGKESAIKLKEEQRETLNEMKRLVEDYPTIESVYFFAVDRLARKMSVVLNIVDWALEHNINITFLNPHPMSTLKTDKDGNRVEDSLTKLFLAMLSYGAEMEMKLKQARFNTRKKEMKEEGKLPQGKPIKGYRLGEGRKIDRDEFEAPLVRQLFKDYLEGNESLNSIHEKYVAKGLFKPVLSRYCNAGRTRIWSMLKDAAYKGGERTIRRKVTKAVNGKQVVEYIESAPVKYPAIVEEEIFDAVQSKLEGRRKEPKKDHKHTYYAKGLVSCGICENSMKVNSTDKTYTCKEIKGHTVNVSVNVIDYIVWEMAKAWNNYYTFLDWETAKKGYEEKLGEAKFNLLTAMREIEDLNNEIYELNKDYRSPANRNKKRIPESYYNEQIDRWNKDIEALEKKSVKYQNAITSYTNLISECGLSPLQSPDTIEALSDAERVEVIKKVIKTVKVERYEEKASYKITVEPTDVIEPLAKGDNWVWEYQSKQRSVILHLSETVSEQRVFTRRFEPRKRERAKKRAANKAEQ